MWSVSIVLVFSAICLAQGHDSAADDDNGSDRDLDDSSERLGPMVTQVVRHPYSAALLHNDTFVCSAVLLNKHWLLTLSKCFEPEGMTAYYRGHNALRNYSVRVGSSYNNKGGELYKIRTLVNNNEVKVTAVKLQAGLNFNSRVQPVRLPAVHDDVNLGYLASMIAWTPIGHMRVVNAPIMDWSICEPYTNLPQGQYICLGGVQDPNRHFCRTDQGGAVVQNDTLIGITSFIQKCALYTRPHAFPKIASFIRWLDAMIWDEEPKWSTTTTSTSTLKTTVAVLNKTETPVNRNPYVKDPRKFMLTLPFDPINVPLQPAEDNSVIPRMSLYESYLQNFVKKTSSTTQDPIAKAMLEKKWKYLQKYRKTMMSPQPNGGYGRSIAKKYESFEYN